MTLQEFKGRHKGKQALIAGCGVTLSQVNPDEFKDSIIICVNDSLLHFPKADYFFATDTYVTKEKAIYEVNRKVKDVIVCEDLHGYQKEFGVEDERFHKVFRKPGWVMKDDDLRLIQGMDAVQCAVHFAIILGCSPVVLVGCDCKQIDGKHYFWETQPTKVSMTGLNLSNEGLYLMNLANRNAPIFNASPDSAMRGIKHAPIEKFKDNPTKITTQDHKFEGE